MDQLKFMIESSEAKNMVKKQGLNSVLELLPAIVRSTQKLARPPISGFSVSAVGLSSDGRIFIGVNIEFPGLPLHQTVHAEQFLITNLSNYPGTTLTNIVVSAYPCGHCRQFLQEIRGAQGIQLYVLDSIESEGGNVGEINACFKPLSYFLPHRFGPDDLLEKNAPLVLETRENRLDIDQSLLNENHTLKFDVKRVALAALEAANRSHAPYSGYASGVAIIDEDDNVYKGRYMESAAYNPSIGPAQAAVIAYIAATEDGEESETGYGKINGAVLVEKEGGLVRQEDTVRLFFKAVSPKCQFYVFHCKDLK